MSKVIRLNNTLEKLINDLKEEYIFFYRSTSKTKNQTLKEMAQKEIQRAEEYDEKTWIKYALYKELTNLREINKEEKI